MLCVGSGQCQYLRKNFHGKTFMVSKNLQKSRKFSPLNDLTYMVFSPPIYTCIGIQVVYI